MIRIVKGDIAGQDTEAVVNASNKELAWEELTVNGVIQCGGGHELISELQKIHENYGDLKTGEVIITQGYKLPYKYVLHTVGPVYPCNRFADEELEKTYNNCFYMAHLHDIKSITFPAISTGVFAFPIIPATEICKKVTDLWADKFDEIRFCCYTETFKSVYEKIFNA